MSEFRSVQRLLSVALLAFAGPWAVADQYLLLPVSSGVLTRMVQPSQLLYHEDGVSLVRVSTSEVSIWTEQVHESLGGCGGFLDVTAEIESGRAPASLVWDEIMRMRWSAPPIRFEVTGAKATEDLVARASADRYWAFLKELTDLPDRSALSDNGTKAAQFLETRARSLGTELAGFKTWTVETVGTYHRQPSVVATLPGEDPSLPHVVVGAHMDTFDSKPGADDDGSGTAAVMETLRAIAESRASFKHTVDFVWYAAEERGLVGSKHVVQRFEKDGIKVKSALQLDMVGYKSPDDDEDIYLITDHTNEDLNKALRELAVRYVGATVGETRCGYPCSDHYNWTRAGVPAAFPFETKFANLNRRLHTKEDVMTALDRDHALRFVRLALAYVSELAQVQEPRRLGEF